MRIYRTIQHLSMTDGRVKRAFSVATMKTIEATIRACEAEHVGEICFVVESALGTTALLQNQSSQDRALELFSSLRVWDTEHNCDVLIYLLFADRQVEIIADRGIQAKSGSQVWAQICEDMSAAFKEGKFEEGSLQGIRAVARQLHGHFPNPSLQGNELPDHPVLL
jgi:uncharacterized membrane protein